MKREQYRPTAIETTLVIAALGHAVPVMLYVHSPISYLPMNWAAAYRPTGAQGVSSSSVGTHFELERLLNMRQSLRNKQAVESILSQWENQYAATRAIPSSKLVGRWRLRWSSQTASTNPFALPSSVLGAVSFQDIEFQRGSEQGRASNIVQWAPRWQLIGGATTQAARRNSPRTLVRIDDVRLELGPVRFDLNFADLQRFIDGGKRQADAPAAGLEGGLGHGWLETVCYVDGFRVTRDNVGNLYVYSREPSRTSRSAVRMHAESETSAEPERTGGTPAADFQGTSPFVQGVVSSLTALVNAVSGKTMDEPAALEADSELRPPLTPSELLEGVRDDYVARKYLWTGDIDPNLYDSDCVFTDPTLSFKGLSTFQRNIANLKPLLDALVRDPVVDLYSISSTVDETQIKATWRMKGEIALPWAPVIDLTGSTVFTYDPLKGNRITEYTESWDISAASALGQLLRPGAREA